MYFVKEKLEKRIILHILFLFFFLFKIIKSPYCFCEDQPICTRKETHIDLIVRKWAQSSMFQLTNYWKRFQAHIEYGTCELRRVLRTMEIGTER